VGAVSFDDAIQGRSVLAFVGDVVELFTERAGSVGRIHAHQLHCEIKPPNRKGYREVDFSPSVSGHGGFKVTVADDGWSVVQQVIAEIETARAQR
jgi:hypothetical protein